MEVGFKNGVHAVKVAILPGSGRGHSEIVDHGDGVWLKEVDGQKLTRS